MCLPTFGANSCFWAKAPQQSPTSSCSPLTALHPGKATERWLSQGKMARWGRSPVSCACCRCSTEKTFSWRDLHGYIHAPLYVVGANRHSITRQGKMIEHHFVHTTESHLYPFQYKHEDHSIKLKSKSPG